MFPSYRSTLLAESARSLPGPRSPYEQKGTTRAQVHALPGAVTDRAQVSSEMRSWARCAANCRRWPLVSGALGVGVTHCSAIGSR